MKTDDDAFVRIDEVLSSLKKNVPQGLLYGQIAFESSPHRDKDSKWYISPEVIKLQMFSEKEDNIVSIETLDYLSEALFCRNGRTIHIHLGRTALDTSFPGISQSLSFKVTKKEISK